MFLNYSQNLSRFFTVQFSTFFTFSLLFTSRRQLLKYISFASVCPQLFYFLFAVLCRILYVSQAVNFCHICSARVSFVIIPWGLYFVNHKLQIYLISDNFIFSRSFYLFFKIVHSFNSFIRFSYLFFLLVPLLRFHP